MIPTLQLAGRGNALASPPAPVLFDLSTLRVVGDGSGASLVDRSPSGRMVTANGGILNSATVVGSGAWSLVLDGTGDYASIPDSAAWDTADATVWEALLYIDVASFAAGHYYTLLAQSSSGNPGHQLFVYADSTTNATLYWRDAHASGNVANITSASTLVPRTVYHVAIAANGPGAMARLFLAGTLVASVSPSATPVDMTSALLIGGYSDGGAYFPGRDFLGNLKVRISNFARYSRANFAPPTDFAVDDPAAPVTSTWNPSDKGASVVLRGSNYIMSATATAQSVRGTVGRAASGHYYFEIVVGGPDGQHLVGVGNTSASLSSFPGSDANGWGYYGAGPQKFNGSGTSYGATFTAGDVIGVEIDNGALTFHKNGTSQGSAYTGITGTLYPMVGMGTGGGGPRTGTLNVGQLPWDGTLPSGAAAWG